MYMYVCICPIVIYKSKYHTDVALSVLTHNDETLMAAVELLVSIKNRRIVSSKPGDESLK